MSIQTVRVVLVGTFPRGDNSFLSFSIVRVDPSGNDATGTVGNTGLPFLTVQGAINAIQSGSFAFPIVDIGNNIFTEDVTTSLAALQFVGSGQPNQPFHSLTSTAASGAVDIYLTNINSCNENDFDIAGATSGSLEIYVVASTIRNITNSNGSILCLGFGGANIGGIVSAPNSGGITINNFDVVSRINSAGSNIALTYCKLIQLIAAANITLTDSRIVINSAGITPTYSDVLLNDLGAFGKLLPTVNPPSNPVEGWIYADTDHHLYYYNGTTWKQLDN